MRSLMDLAGNLMRSMATFDKRTDAFVAVSRNGPQRPVNNDKLMQAVARKALADVRPTIKAMLLTNLTNSGLKKHDNDKLFKAVEDVIVGAKFDIGKPWRIYIAFQPEISDYVSPGGAYSNPYMVFAAQNHGWVRGPAGAGRPSTKALANRKKKILEERKSVFQAKGHTFTVVKPHPFFYLNPGQMAQVKKMWMTAFETRWNQTKDKRHA